MDKRLQLEESASPRDHDAAWLTVKQVAAFEGISRQECYNRMKPGDAHPLVSKDRREIDGCRGRLILARSMTFNARARWRGRLLADEVKVKPSLAAPVAYGQLSLLPRTEVDEQMAALDLPSSQRDVAFRRLRAVELCLNHDWKVEGYPSGKAHVKAIAKANETSARNLYRWIVAWKHSKNVLDLIKDRPGPEPGTITKLTPDMRAHLQRCWVADKLTVRQCHDSLKRYIETKQNSPGCRVDHIYPEPPSRATVGRFIRSLSPLDHAFRQGPDALNAACGYVDRTYRDCKSLGRVEVDEWKCDFFAYDAKRPKIARRWWLLTFYDARSIYPLVGKLVAGSDSDLKHGIDVRDEIEILVRLLKEYGLPGTIYSDHGRFRGKTFGGRTREKGIKEFDGILDRLGIRKSEPREKNPRGSRLERFHRYLADQSRTVPGWIGSNDKERGMTHGDQHAALHGRWVKGDTDVRRAPLLSTIEAMQKIDGWMNAWRDHESEGTDMDGISPRAVFQHNIPEGGFRKLSDGEIAWGTAERIRNKKIRPGGIVELPDGTRYSHPALILLQGQRREVVRLRDDHSKISVLPAVKGEERIIAPRREPVGTNDPENLARAMESLNRVRKIVGKIVEPLQLQADAPLPESDAAPLPAPALPEISGPEYVMQIAAERRETRKLRALGFADME